MQLRDVNYYSDVLISIDIYAQSHSKRPLEEGGGVEQSVFLINHSINKVGHSQVGGSNIWWGRRGIGSHALPHAPPPLLSSM